MGRAMGLTLHYRKEKRGLELVRCYGNDSVVSLPDTVDGQPFKILGDYAFSQWKKQEEEDVEIYDVTNNILQDDEKELLCGNLIEAVHLPDKTEELGKYA